MEMRVRDCGEMFLAKRFEILDNIQESNRSLRALRQAQCKLREVSPGSLVEIATLRLPLRYAQGSG